MTVISVTPEKGRLLKVATDSGKTFFLQRDFAVEQGVRAGNEYSDEETENLLAESEYRRARERGLWFLDRADRSEKSLYEKIVQGGISAAAAARAVARFKELGLVDDRRFCENLFLSLREQNVPKRAMYLKMFTKGVPKGIISEVLRDNEQDEDAACAAVLQKKYAKKLREGEDPRKTAAALLRRGFSYGAVKQALNSYNTELESGEEFDV